MKKRMNSIITIINLQVDRVRLSGLFKSTLYFSSKQAKQSPYHAFLTLFSTFSVGSVEFSAHQRVKFNIKKIVFS